MMHHTLTKFIPILGWAPRYQRSWLSGDIAAGLTTAIMLIPQGMAYAMLAGLPPIHGLYASLLPLLIYAIFGTSRQLAVGPVAMDSLLVATGVGALAEVGSEAFIAYAVLLALMVGALQVVMGLGRLGFLVNFLSQPVMSGFTSAAALIIGVSQLKHLLGVPLARSSYVHEVLRSAAERLSEVSALTLLLGLVSMALLMVLKKKAPKIPRALVVVVLGTLVTWWFGLDQRGVSTVGAIPAGLPGFALPTMNTEILGDLFALSMTIALVAFMEAIAVSKALASKAGYEIDANQELIALGLSNIGGSLTSGYPITGGFSRSAVNASAGAKTPLASVITGGVIIVALLWLTPLFYHLPHAVLASIIMVAVFGLIDVEAPRRLWKVKRSDLVLLLITFVATLGLGIQTGIGVGVGVSLLWFVVRTTRPHFAVLGRIPETHAYRNLKNYPDAIRTPGVLIVRMDAQFYFGNISFLRERLAELIDTTDEPLRALIIDASAMNQLDSSAACALDELARGYRDMGIQFLMANVKRPVLNVLLLDDFFKEHCRSTFFLTVHDAATSQHNASIPCPDHEASSLL